METFNQAGEIVQGLLIGFFALVYVYLLVVEMFLKPMISSVIGKYKSKIFINERYEHYEDVAGDLLNEHHETT